MVTYRSNYGPKNQRTKFNITYDQTRGKLQLLAHPSSDCLPLYLVQKRKRESFWSIQGANYQLIKPNKHYLKQFESNVFFKKGVMEMNLFFKPIDSSSQRVKHVPLVAYPSIINQQEHLVIEVDQIPAELGIKEERKKEDETRD